MYPREHFVKMIRQIRYSIRTHRDQKGDDRCWLDDYLVWKFLDEGSSDLQTMPSFLEGMRLCRDFFIYRRVETPDPIPPDAIQDPLRWDDDLVNMDLSMLQSELERLKQALAAHRDVFGRLRTFEDDRRLYAELPEKMPADFRLPPEEAFLGEAAAPCAGCPSFWRSHAPCSTRKHDLHKWGPCEE